MDIDPPQLTPTKMKNTKSQDMYAQWPSFFVIKGGWKGTTGTRAQFPHHQVTFAKDCTRLFLHYKHVWYIFDRLQENLLKCFSTNTIIGSVTSIILEILSIPWWTKEKGIHQEYVFNHWHQAYVNKAQHKKIPRKSKDRKTCYWKWHKNVRCGERGTYFGPTENIIPMDYKGQLTVLNFGFIKHIYKVVWK